MSDLIIYQIRENYVHYSQGPESRPVELMIDSEPVAYFQSLASAQLHVQELINLRLEARVQSAEKMPHLFQNSPQALANIAANKLYFDATGYKVNNNTDKPDLNLEIFVILELTVKP